MSTLDLDTSRSADVHGPDGGPEGSRRGDLDGAPTGHEPGAEAVVFDPSRPYAVHPQVALRPEPFGALAYHYGNRRLVFLKHNALVALVRSLGDHPTVDAALDDAIGTGALSLRQRSSYLKALASLAASDVLCAREEL